MAVYACSDLHGDYELYNKINNMLHLDDIVYFLGDACDRGPDGWKLITDIYNNPHWHYIKGNHEDMLVKAMRGYYGEYSYEDMYLWISNGGEPTYNSMIALDEEVGKSWVRTINSLPIIMTYLNKQGKNIILTHAGYTPNQLDDYPDFNKQLIWGRNHFDDSWGGYDENTIIVHGHTPVRYLDNLITKGISGYCEGHKYCIDLHTYRSHQALLLNLDTFEETIVDNFPY